MIKILILLSTAVLSSCSFDKYEKLYTCDPDVQQSVNAAIVNCVGGGWWTGSECKSRAIHAFCEVETVLVKPY